MPRRLVGTLFLLSGATALCYQVAWTRHLVLVFGNTTHAVALILAAYMLGLALGSEWGGRLADRNARPGLLYAVAEIAIGLFVLLFAPLLGLVQAGYLELGGAGTPVLFLGAFLVLLVPTFLMGATLPLLVRATVDDAGRTGGTVGTLYGLNLLGAVLGTAFTGFYLIEAAGVLGATYWAAAVNGLIGVLGLMFLRSPRAVGAGEDESVDEIPRGADEAFLIEMERRAAGAKAALVAVFAGGMVGLGAEVVWTRLLVFFLQGFTYTFSAMLAVFLLGLGIGGFIFGRIADRSREPVVVLGRLQVAIGVASAAVLLVLGHHLALTEGAWEVAGSVVGAVMEQPDLRVHHVLTLLLASAAALLLPATLMGGVFPLASAAYQKGLTDLGSRIGRLYAANTLGAVCGALVAGFVLAPTLGMVWGAVVVAGLSVAAGWIVLQVSGQQGGRLWTVPLLGVAAAGGLVFLAEPTKPFLLRSHVFQGPAARENRLVETLEGVVCQVSVVENEREGYTLLYTDEFQAAGTKPEYRYMRMLAHLPVALAERPERVLCICWGTGTTCGSVSTHDVVKELDIVEISPEVLSVADRFEEFNRGALEGAGRDDLTVRVHVDDGRHFVLRSRAQWDVITLEPLMPYTPAAIHFYTREFYEECLPRIAPGGLMCQWIPLQGMSGEHFKQLVRSFVDVFPDSACFFVDGAVALIGGPQPVEMVYDRVAERLGAPRVLEDLGAVGYADPARALATHVASGAQLREFAADVEAITDEFPVLEFHPIPLRVGVKHLWENLQAVEQLRKAVTDLPVRVADGAEPGVQTRLVRSHRVSQEIAAGQRMLEESALYARIGRKDLGLETFLESRTTFGRAAQIDPGDPTAERLRGGVEREWQIIQAGAALDAEDLERAEGHLLRALEFPALRQADVVWTMLAETRNRGERFGEALRAAVRSTRRYPRGRDGLAERAYARGALRDYVGAARDYRAALGADSLDVLPTRLANDARQLLQRVAPAPQPTEDDVIAAIEKSLAAPAPGPSDEGVSARLALGILAADHRDIFDAYFAEDLARVRSLETPAPDRAAALERIRRAAPTGTVDALTSAFRDGAASLALRRASAAALAELDAPGFVAALPTEPAASAAACWAEAAGQLPARHVADRLLDLLAHPELIVRRAAWLAAFGVLGADAPGLQRLEVERLDDASYRYRDRVQDVRAWWLRNRSELRFSR